MSDNTGKGMGKRVLIAEDEGIIARDLDNRLRRRGFIVSSIVASGEDAILKAEADRPDLILMDIVLHGIDGIEAADNIRQRFDIPIIYLTAFADDRVLDRAKLTEPYGYIVKPFEDRELYSTIEMALYKHGMEKRVREREKWFSTILHSIGDGVIASDKDGKVSFMNPVAEKLTGWPLTEAKDRPLAEIFHIADKKWSLFCENPVETAMLDSSVFADSCDSTLLSRHGTERGIACQSALIRDKNDVVLGIVLVFRDITEKKRMDLALFNSEQKLRIHAAELEESNIALKVLLKQRENDKRELEENILMNVKQLILPYVDKLKKSRAISNEIVYLNMLETNLKQIISPFSSRLSSRYLGFTPREIAIADLIRDGRQDKDIMEILNISYETVKSHRQNIRKKLGIYGKRVNLRSFLLTLSS